MPVPSFVSAPFVPLMTVVMLVFAAPALCVSVFALRLMLPATLIAAPAGTPPAFVVSSDTLAPRTTAFENVNGPPAVVKFAFRLMFNPVPAVSVIAFVFVCEIAALTVTAPLLALPICSVPAVMRSSSASVSPRVSGLPVSTSAPPRLIKVPAVRVLIVVVEVPLLMVPDAPTAMLSALMMIALFPPGKIRPVLFAPTSSAWLSVLPDMAVTVVVPFPAPILARFASRLYPFTTTP